MLCLKGMDNEVAAKVARHPAKLMSRSKDFALYIRDKYPNVKLSLRWVLLEDITDNELELTKLVAFAKELDPVFTHIELIPYHELGRDKYDSLEEPYPLDDMKPYDTDDALKVQRALQETGLRVDLAVV